MNGPVSKLARCAIYTRKSTEHNLDLAFNSLDAQREACEAYIKSQAHEGWRLIPVRYDDGVFSGASLDRPALQQLLADVRASKIDIVLVYKVDRLTRSLADFAKLIELFDAHGVSFVSVTQSFNTSSSMGRLTLNVLLSFAQFERELIGERVRDKIAASKRKGLWVGGPVPLGYAAVDKKIVGSQPRLRRFAPSLRAIWSLAPCVRWRRTSIAGIRSKPRRLSNGRTFGGGRFGVGALAYLLKNRFYIGEVVYRGEVHRGEHEPILHSSLFEAVQAKLAAQAVARRCRLRGSPALLTGRLFDDRGNRMSPTHTNKGGVRYRYYVSQAVLQGKPQTAGLVGRVPAAELEAFVIAALRKHLSASAPGRSCPTMIATFRAPSRARDLGPQRSRASAEGDRRCLREAHDPVNDGSSGPPIAERHDDGRPLDQPRPRRRQGHHPCARAQHADQSEPPRDALLIAIAKARQWIDDLAHGRAGRPPRRERIARRASSHSIQFPSP